MFSVINRTKRKSWAEKKSNGQDVEKRRVMWTPCWPVHKRHKRNECLFFHY